MRAVSRNANFWLSLYPHYEKGVLWRGGGIMDQPYAYLQAMQLIGDEVSKVLKERKPGSPAT
jgi:hypothetical protein